MAAGIILLLAGAMLAVLVKSGDTGGTAPTPDLSFAATPTPQPLRTLAKESPSYFRTVLRQIFRRRGPSVDPFEILNGQRQAEGEYLDLYTVNGYLPVDVKWWQKESKQVYEYVARRLDATAAQKAIVAFVPPKLGNCAPRGTTYHEQQPVIVIFADQSTSKQQIVAVLAHEIGHVLIHQKYEKLSDTALNEGMATWAAADYWKAWKGADFDSVVRSFIKDKTYLPLFQNYYLEKAYDEDSPDCITHRDILMSEMASFLEYLIQKDGTEKLSALFDMPQPEVTGARGIFYPPRFKMVYGLEFNQLEYGWLGSLLQAGR
jgi:hypothetical protein